MWSRASLSTSKYEPLVFVPQSKYYLPNFAQTHNQDFLLNLSPDKNKSALTNYITFIGNPRVKVDHMSRPKMNAATVK